MQLGFLVSTQAVSCLPGKIYYAATDSCTFTAHFIHQLAPG